MRFRFCGALVFGALLVAGSSGAQQARPAATDSAFQRAVALVNDGQGVEGRAVLDSLVAAARPGSHEYAEAVYWRASVAPSAAEAERDYRRIIIDHPLSPRVPDALLRLAQLELARGDRAAALRHLQRLELEFPSAPGRARTSYWTARVLLEQDDLTGGCAAVAEARARALPSDVELRNQIDFIAQRCPTRTATGVVAPAGGRTVTASGTARDTRPWMTVPDTIGRPVTAGAPNSARPWSVQVAAFNTRAQADRLVSRLRAQRRDARVDGTAAPFRVRIGRYATRAAAAEALRVLKAAGRDGFVVHAGSR